MSSSSDTATPVVIVSAVSSSQIRACVEEFLKEFITDPSAVRFLNGVKLPTHGITTVEFVGFSLQEIAALDKHMDSFRDYFLPYFKDEILVIINPSAAYMVKKL